MRKIPNFRGRDCHASVTRKQWFLNHAPTTFPASQLLPDQRIDLAIQAMTSPVNISRLAAEHKVSRKFVYQQKSKATLALKDVFAPTGADNDVLFYLPVTKAWLYQVILALTLVCHVTV